MCVALCADNATVFWTRMGLLVLTVLCIPAAIFFVFSGWLVEHVFGQPHHLAVMSGQYTILLTPGLFFITWFSVLQKNLQVCRWACRSGPCLASPPTMHTRPSCLHTTIQAGGSLTRHSCGWLCRRATS